MNNIENCPTMASQQQSSAGGQVSSGCGRTRPQGVAAPGQAGLIPQGVAAPGQAGLIPQGVAARGQTDLIPQGVAAPGQAGLIPQYVAALGPTGLMPQGVAARGDKWEKLKRKKSPEFKLRCCTSAPLPVWADDPWIYGVPEHNVSASDSRRCRPVSNAFTLHCILNAVT